ncbi:MAG: DUF6261 family protein [Tannerellaceae bacterium]|jgi:hypothetical protein|nr:DUF6261 family protein [Tannerellaceae bacterium]
MEITKFNPAPLRIEEWFRMHTEFYGLVKLCGVDVLNMERLFPPYEILYKEGDELLEILRKSFITADTQSADRLRGRIFRGLRNAAKSYQYTPNTEKQNAGAKVNAVIRKYSSAILKGSRAEKTAAIDNLLQDLTPKEGSIDLSAEIQILSLEVWVTDLKAANTAYKQSLSERVEETVARPDVGRLKQVRIEMDRYYTNMTNAVNALLLVIDVSSGNDEEELPEEPSGPVEDLEALPSTPDGKILHFAKALNAYIAYYKSLLKGRRTRSSKKQEQEEESTEDTL